MDESSQYAPIIIPTLNRIEHLRLCISSLKRNTLAPQSDLIISLDYPPEEKYMEGYLQICSYFDKEIGGFRSVQIIRQSKNLGPYGNYVFLKEYVKQQGYTRFIFTEDDNEFSPNFLIFINKGLELFKNDERIIAVCSNGIASIDGYNGSIALTQNFSAQGYGMWCVKDDLLKTKITRENFELIAQDYAFLKEMWRKDKSIFFSFKSAILQDQNLYRTVSGEIPIVDMTIKVYMIKEKKYCIAPIVMTSRNHGYDGSGVNCPKIEGKIPNIDKRAGFEYNYTKDIPTHTFKLSYSFMDYIKIGGCLIKMWIYFIRKKMNRYDEANS